MGPDWPTAQFMFHLHDKLQGRRELGQTGFANDFFTSGMLEISRGVTHCRIEISRNWVSQPPSVFCTEPWMRQGADWHAGSDGLLCYVLKYQWRDVLKETLHKSNVPVTIDVSCSWLLRNVQWLLNKHLLAHQLKIDAWPPSWDYWPHGDNEAYEQYLASA